MDLSVKYMGLKLRNPLVASASPLTYSLENLRAFEDQGIGAVVVRSLFEEEINQELDSQLDREDMYFWYPEAASQVKKHSKGAVIQPYLQFIESAKQEVKVPVIASINCFSSGDWIKFARKLEDAGADALELNVATHLPYDETMSSRELEDTITEVVESVTQQLDIPVAVKIGPFFSNLIGMAKGIEQAGASGLVIFNRFYRPDIDINNLEVISDHHLSSPREITFPLRWVSILYNNVTCDLAASTGVHGYDGVVKQLLAGATVTQLCSVLYLEGAKRIAHILEDLERWMGEQGFDSIKEFKGRISADSLSSAKFEQVQFIERDMDEL